MHSQQLKNDIDEAGVFYDGEARGTASRLAGELGFELVDAGPLRIARRR